MMMMMTVLLTQWQKKEAAGLLLGPERRGRKVWFH